MSFYSANAFDIDQKHQQLGIDDKKVQDQRQRRLKDKISRFLKENGTKS